MSDSAGCCAHLSVKYKTKPVGINGAVTGWWECDDCQTQFIPRGAASPAEVPTPLLTNLRYLGGRLRSELSDASMLYPKCFHLEAVQQLIAAWDEVAVEAVKVEAAGPKPGPRCPICLDALDTAIKGIRVRYSRDRGEPDPTPAFPYEAALSVENYHLLTEAAAAIRAFFTPSAGEPQPHGKETKS